MKNQNLFRALGRARRMGLAELACRGRQETSAFLERVYPSSRTDASAVLFELTRDPELRSIRRAAASGASGRAARELLSRFRELAPGRFFAGAVETSTPRAIETTPLASGAILEEAESLLHNRFDLLGYPCLTFGDPVNWHRDPISTREAPLVHWSRIDPLDPDSVGDVKLVWELNRHQWLVRLAEAYRLTEDERFVRKIASDVLHWKRFNPRGIGVNWTSSLEVAFRLIAWCWTLVLVLDAKALDDGALFTELLDGIRSHASHVEKYASYYFSPNTHLTGEALGLFYAGTLFTELAAAPRWREVGRRILLQQIEEQVLPDGVYFEQSTCYQRYTVDIYLHFLLLARRNGVLVPRRPGEAIERMVDFLLEVRCPDGSMPEIGDADGGRLMPLARRRPDDFSDVFSTAACLFRRAEFAWAAGEVAPETRWLLGVEGEEAFRRLRPRPPQGGGLRIFPDGGYAVMRSSWANDAHHLVFDFGPLGCPMSSGHGHADLLSVQCCAYGERFVVDPGTFRYALGAEERDYFRASAAHSTAVVDGLSQAVPEGPFRWAARPAARLVRSSSAEKLAVVEAEHDAYARLAEPVNRHRRRLVFLDERFWVLVDSLEGVGTHDVELRFQLAPLDVSLEGESWARARGSRGGGLLLGAFSSAALRGEVQEGWVSPAYGVRERAPVVAYVTRARLPIRVFTLLLPLESASSPLPASSWIEDVLARARKLCDRGESCPRERLRRQ